MQGVRAVVLHGSCVMGRWVAVHRSVVHGGRRWEGECRRARPVCLVRRVVGVVLRRGGDVEDVVCVRAVVVVPVGRGLRRPFVGRRVVVMVPVAVA